MALRDIFSMFKQAPWSRVVQSGQQSNDLSSPCGNTTTNSNNTTDNSGVYNDSNHIEFLQPNFVGPVGLGNVTIHYPISPQTREDLEKFATTHCADGAAFNSRRSDHEQKCLKDTRADLLKDILHWSDMPNDACIFWLNGMAGTGKSTIARTVARQWADEKRLGASFFFSRGQGDRAHASKFFTTLAYQLTYAQPGLAASIHKAICERPDIARQGLREQWQHLIVGPLSQPTNGSSQLQSLMLVIDALDECDDENDTGLILQLLSEAKSFNSVRLLVFVTSRPETPVRYGFIEIPKAVYQHFILHGIPSQTVDHDIYVFFQHEFGRIRTRRWRVLPNEWPDEQSLGILVRKAGGLFIYAATVCRFIGDKGSPQDLLTLVLDDSMENGSPMEQLDLMYMKLLQYAVRDDRTLPREENLMQQFKRIVGSIVILFEAMTASALAALLDSQLHEVDQMVESLSSVLNYPENDDIPIKLLHPSFRDFLLDNRRCADPQLRIVGVNAHRELAVSCLELMSKHLKQDVCSLKLPGSLVREVDRATVQRCLPQEVQYACRHWVDHLQRSNFELHDSESNSLHVTVHTFLMEHLLHWLEALSLMESMHDGILMVRTIDSMLTPDADGDLRAMARDAVRFVLKFRSIIEIAPLQLYCSALTLSPKRSKIREQFWKYVPDWISDPPAVPMDWDSLMQVLEGHWSEVCAVAFSPDGKLVASASHDKTVRLWDPTTGTCRSILEGHSSEVLAVAFSPDGKLVASASKDKTVRLWDPTTGTCRSILEGHSSWVTAVAFSPDGKLVASASEDTTVRLWDPTTGTCRSILEGHSSEVLAVAFSPDGKLVASASKDKTVRLWDPTTGTCRSILEGHSSWVTAVAFSPDGKLVASASEDTTVRLWDPTTGTCRSILEGHSSWVTAVAFSPDGKLVASAPEDKTVRLWDPTTGTCRSILEGHSSWVTAVAFSPDGKLVASASHDKTVRLWDPTTGTCRSILEGHSSEVLAVAFSPDGKLVASASEDTTVRLWDPTTGTCRSILEGHLSWVTAVAFSPDGKLVASASKDTTVRLWDPTTGTCRSILEGHSSWVTAVAFSPDGKLVASASEDTTVRLWDPTTGTCRSILEGHSSWVTAVAFSPDGKLVASASHDKTVRLWDPTTGTCRSILEGHSSWVTAVAFSPDGKLVASASEDTTVRLWDPTTGTCRSILEGYSSWVHAVASSPDGKLLTFILADNVVRVSDHVNGILHAVNIGDNAHSPPMLYVREGCIFLGMRKIFHLTPDYQTRCFVAHNNTIALGHLSGRVSFIGFDVESVPLE